MASEWPAWVVLYAARDRKATDPYEAFSLSDDDWPWRVSLEKESGIYLHRDAARAWQAFRDWLNGVDDGEMAEWRRALRETRISSYREGSEHANLAWTTGVYRR